MPKTPIIIRELVNKSFAIFIEIFLPFELALVDTYFLFTTVITISGSTTMRNGQFTLAIDFSPISNALELISTDIVIHWSLMPIAHLTIVFCR